MSRLDTPVLQVGEEYEVEAVRLNDDGDAVTKVKGITVFVPGLLPGERATITLTTVDKRFARGRMTAYTDAARHRYRQQPDCAVFGQCGGCQLQHLSYEIQLEHKRQMVVETLARFGKLQDIEVHPTLGMEHPWEYRNQVQVPLVFHPATGHVRSGFFARESHVLVETDVCRLEPSEMEKTVQSAVDMLQAVWGEAAKHVHHLIVRQSFTTGEQMLILAVDEAKLPWDILIPRLMSIDHVVSLASTVQPKRTGMVWGPSVQHRAGKANLTEKLCGMEFLISPRSFFQVNTLQAETLYRTALSFAAVSADDSVLDAYCGTGTISLLMAQQAKQVMGIESIAAAIEDARKNAQHNGVSNATFQVGAVEHVLPKLVEKNRRPFDVVVVDPPRRGCERSVLDALLAAAPKRIVYVSCNHITLARDLRILVDGGYELRVVQPVDMFPQTSHVEVVARLERPYVTP